MTIAQPLLDVNGLTVQFDTRHGIIDAVAGVDLTLEAGRCLALVGESGSGKSVTARTLLGLAGPRATVNASTLSFDGHDLLAADEAAWRRLRGRRIGLVLQDALTSLDPLRRIEEEVAEPLDIHAHLGRRERRERVRAALAQVGVPEPEQRARQFPHELSGGLRQRALIASAIAADPTLIVADEPTTALDVTVQAQVLDLLATLRDSGTAILLISHDLTVVARMADDIAVMHAGRIVERGPTDKVLTRPKHAYTQALLAAAPTILGSRRCKAPSAAQPAERRQVLEVVDVAKRYRSPGGGWRQAVDGVTFSLAAGGALGIVGESGSGKSTIAQLTLGMLTPDRGQVFLDGEPWSSLSEQGRRSRRGRIQLVPQDPLSSFDPRHSVERIVGESLGEVSRRGAAARRDEIVALLERVGLDTSVLNRRRTQLSGGQRQRVAIARALGPGPDILVCDEPVSALDVSIQAQILELFTTLRRDLGVALLFISHDLGVIDEVCDDVIVMHEGAVVERGPVTEVLSFPRHPYTRRLLDAVLPRHSPETGTTGPCLTTTSTEG